MRWVALLMVSSLPLAACGGGEFTSAGAGGTSSGGAAGASGVGGSPDGGFGGTGVAGSAGQVGTGGAGGAGGSSGAGGVVNSDCAFPAGLSVPSNPTYHSTLDSREAVRSPAIGVGEGSVISTDPTDDFIGSRCDFGVQINGQGEFFSIPEAGEEHVNIDYRRGTLMFYLTPYFDSSDNASHILFQTAGDQSGGGFTLEKAASNDLRFIAQASGAAGLTFQRYVRGADYSFNANDPIHIAVSWNGGIGPLRTLRIASDDHMTIALRPISVAIRRFSAAAPARS